MIVYTYFSASLYVYWAWFLLGMVTYIMNFVFFCAIKVCEGDLRGNEAKIGVWRIFEVLLGAIEGNKWVVTTTWDFWEFKSHFDMAKGHKGSHMHLYKPVYDF